VCQTADGGLAGAGAVSSSVSGTARDVVQARDVHGGVHFHGTPPAPVLPRQLPADVNGFVGRTGELERLESLLADPLRPGPGLLVVSGTAGAGKSALAVRFAHRARERFPDGQLFVNLHGYDPGPPLAPAAALERFLRALGTPAPAIPQGVEERAELYRSLVADRRMLVVLDNAASADQVRPLLPGEPACLVLVTSRARLSALSAREGARRLTLGLLPQHEAVELIQAVTAGYRIGDEPGQLAQLARLCANLPLALRIAAERAAAHPFMPLGQLIEDLRRRSSRWDALSGDEATEADAVRTVFAWSYRALPPAAARAFRLLGLHPGPDFSVHAATALVDCNPHDVRALLDALAGAHLLDQTGPQRYQFHDLLRAYAADQAAQEEEPAEQRAALHRAAAWYLHSAHNAQGTAQNLLPGVVDEPDPGVRAARFDDRQAAADWYREERPNLLALSRTLAHARMDRELWQLAATLWPLQDAHGAVDDWLEIARLGLQAANRLGDPRARAATLQNAALAHKAAGELEPTSGCFRDTLALYTALGDAAGIAATSTGAGLLHLHRRDLEQAAEHFARAERHAHSHGLHTWSATALNNLAYTRLEQGRTREAAETAERALHAHNRAGSHGAAHLEALLTLIRAHREHGDLQRAEQYADTAQRIIAAGERHLGVQVDILLERAALASARGEHDTALEQYWQCEQLQHPLPGRAREATALTGSGRALTALGRPHEAADFHHRAVALRRTLPDPYRLADALTALADAMDADNQEHEHSRMYRDEALTLLARLPDPRAATLRATLTRSQR
jgi:tetratricopeptide (TPR) repeat protein